MKHRCQNSNHVHYANYGGRGITVCDRWDSFESFLADMGERPEGKTLDRFPDNDGNYEPGNARWATKSEQTKNQRKASHCVNGHEFTVENTWLRPDSQTRVCRTCKRDNDKRYRRIERGLAELVSAYAYDGEGG